MVVSSTISPSSFCGRVGSGPSRSSSSIEAHASPRDAYGDCRPSLGPSLAVELFMMMGRRICRRDLFIWRARECRWPWRISISCAGELGRPPPPSRLHAGRVLPGKSPKVGPRRAALNAATVGEAALGRPRAAPQVSPGGPRRARGRPAAPGQRPPPPGRPRRSWRDISRKALCLTHAHRWLKEPASAPVMTGPPGRVGPALAANGTSLKRLSTSFKASPASLP